MRNKQIKNILLVTVCFIAITTICTIGIIAFYSISNPTISLKPLDKPIGSEVVSAKQIETYLINEIHQIDKFSKYNLMIGSVDMKIDSEHRGEVTVIFVEKDSQNPKVIFAYLDTQRGIFYKFQDMGRERKLYPGIIHLHEWGIDSVEAVRISEEFFCSIKDFRYDEVWIKSYSDSLVDYVGNKERWDVYLTDTENNIRYETRINPYSGEVLVHSINGA